MFILNSQIPHVTHSSSTLEPILLPKLHIHLAEFPYNLSLSVRVLKTQDTRCGIGTTSPPHFHRRRSTQSPLLRIATIQSTAPARKELASAVMLSCRPASPRVAAKSPLGGETHDSPRPSVYTVDSPRPLGNPCPDTNHLQLLLPRSAHTKPPHTLTCVLLRYRVAPLPDSPPENLTRIGPGLLPIHFLKRQIRQVRCNTFLSGCQPPWPPSCCPNQAVRFSLLPLDPLPRRRVHSLSHPMLTTVRPLTHYIHASSEFNYKHNWCSTPRHCYPVPLS